jgi:hypothetical protein
MKKVLLSVKNMRYLYKGVNSRKIHPYCTIKKELGKGENNLFSGENGGI